MLAAATTIPLIFAATLVFAVLRDVSRLAVNDDYVRAVEKAITMHFGPDEVLLIMDVVFHPNLSEAELISTTNRIGKNIRQHFPIIRHIYIEVQGLRQKET